MRIRADSGMDGVEVFEMGRYWMPAQCLCVWDVCQPFVYVTFTEIGGGLRCTSLTCRCEKSQSQELIRGHFKPNHSPHFTVGGMTTAT